MDPVMIVLRTFHILGGALWFGSAFLFAGFFGPAAGELGPAAGPVMSNVVKKRKIAKVIAVLAITTVIAGWTLWLKNALSYASIGDWLTSPFGLVLTIGGLLATFAALLRDHRHRQQRRARRRARRPDRGLGRPADAGAGRPPGAPRRRDREALEGRPRPAVRCRVRDGDRPLLVASAGSAIPRGPSTVAYQRSLPVTSPHLRPERRRARRREPRHDRLALEAARLRLPVERDLRRDQRGLGLRPARRRAEEQRQAGVVAGDGPGARGHRRARRRDPHAPAGLDHLGPRRLVQRPARRVRHLPSPLPPRRAARRRGPQRRPT